MEDWNSHLPFTPRFPRPVLQVYNNIGKFGSASTKQQLDRRPSSTPKDMPKASQYRDDNSLQRVQINSPDLGSELSGITGIFLQQYPIL